MFGFSVTFLTRYSINLRELHEPHNWVLLFVKRWNSVVQFTISVAFPVICVEKKEEAFSLRPLLYVKIKYASCRIKGHFVIYQFTVVLSVAPTIEPILGPVFVSLGRPIRIPCTASGNPRPTITWQKNNQVLTSGTGYTILENGMLMIDSSDMSHAGRYMCIAESKAGTAVLRVDLQVQGRVAFWNTLKICSSNVALRNSWQHIHFL